MLRYLVWEKILAILLQFDSLAFDKALYNQLFEWLPQDIEFALLMLDSVYIAEELVYEASVEQMHDCMLHAADVDAYGHPLPHLLSWEQPQRVQRV